jgi:cleavage and polyadenylation specificity factor subunit 3
MFLEAQFGADNIAPIAIPKVTNQQMTAIESAKDENGADFEGSKEDDEVMALQKQEIERLHKIGIPVPGVAIKVDKMVANVWLEDLEVECANRVFGDRVRAVVERAVEVTAPLWA